MALLNTLGTVQDGITLQAEPVPSDGVVTMNLCNLSGGVMTPISALQIRVVTFG